MKYFIFISCLLGGFVQVQARSIIRAVKADVTLSQHDERLFNYDIESASVEVQNSLQKMILTVKYKDPCPPSPSGIKCMAIAPDDEVIEVPLTQRTYDKTGKTKTVLYVGEEDKIPVDGERRVITVTDLQDFTIVEYVRAFVPRSEGAVLSVSTAKFTGGPLSPF